MQSVETLKGKPPTVFRGAAAARFVRVRRRAEEMLAELKTFQLEVCLIPASDQRHEGHMIRTCQVANPKWYQEFCGLYESNRKDLHRWRKFKTKIKRQSTLKALEAICHGQVRTTYADRLVDFIELEMKNKTHERRSL